MSLGFLWLTTMLCAIENNMAGKVHVKKCSSEEDLESSICSLIEKRAATAIESHGFFTVAFSGGSGAKVICKGLVTRKVDLSKWRILFCDERYVELTHPESNYSIVKQQLLDQSSTSPERVLAINSAISLEESAKEYEAKLKEMYPSEKDVPRLDMLLLGMGPDGHTCSLFPGHNLLNESTKLVAPISDSPKPPPCRITLTFPVINAAHCAAFVATGASKADVIKRVLEGNEEEPLPAARVELSDGDLYWFLDEGSASLLTK